MTSISQADGAGTIDIGGTQSPVSYHVIARPLHEGAGCDVHIELSLPRDWLVSHGFRSQAVLIRQDGTREIVRADREVGIGDPVSVVLTSQAKSVMSEKELGDSFPELLIH